MFGKKVNLRQHVRQVHTSSRSFPCPLCGQVLKNKGGIREHIKLVHVSARPYECSECGQAFKRQTHLTRHINCFHSTIKRTTPCSHCGKMVTRLDEHLKSYSEEKPHECLVCKMKFRNPQQLKIHKRIHSGEKPYYCHICLSSFRTRAAMLYHKKSVHNVIETPFKCGTCTKGFTTLKILIDHSKMHMDCKKKGSNDKGQIKLENVDDNLEHWKKLYNLKDCFILLTRI